MVTESSIPPEKQVQEAILLWVRLLVDSPERVDVDMMSTNNTVIYEIRVAREEVGQVIGLGGQTIKAIRKLAYAVLAKDDMRGMISVIE